MSPRVIVAYGTRPERIKLEPVVNALNASGVTADWMFTGQSKDLVSAHMPVMGQWEQGLVTGIAETMRHAERYFNEARPDACIVQGDTATAFACAQAAFLARVPVAHVEAGMRTYADEPWPEEAFRRQIAAVARWHFAPDRYAAENLEAEGAIAGSVFNVGNTLIDTLPPAPFNVLATLHRRENWGARRQRALRELVAFGHAHGANVRIIRHPNGTADYDAELTPLEQNEWLAPPMEHADLLDSIRDAALVVTDSGGLQEEAAHFGVPCLVLRTSTERVALERTGAIELIDPDNPGALRSALERAVARRHCYGAGDASARIADVLARDLTNGG